MDAARPIRRGPAPVLHLRGAPLLFRVFQPAAPHLRARAKAGQGHSLHTSRRSCLLLSLCSVPGELACQREREHRPQQAAAGGEERATPSVRVGEVGREDLANAPQWCLCTGRNPRVALKSMVDISSLTYFCTARKDGAEGTCKIRQLPPKPRASSAGWPGCHWATSSSTRGKGSLA